MRSQPFAYRTIVFDGNVIRLRQYIGQHFRVFVGGNMIDEESHLNAAFRRIDQFIQNELAAFIV